MSMEWTSSVHGTTKLGVNRHTSSRTPQTLNRPNDSSTPMVYLRQFPQRETVSGGHQSQIRRLRPEGFICL